MPGSFSCRMSATASNRKGKVNRSNLGHICTLVVSTRWPAPEPAQLAARAPSLEPLLLAILLVVPCWS
jgi:hypothetical protein